MPDDKQYLCSELIKVSAAHEVQIGNLEQIRSEGCTISAPESLPAGTEVRMNCIECPIGKRVCKECRFEGLVLSADERGPLGNSIEIEFKRRRWSPEEWRPRHLTSLPESDDSVG